MMPRGQSGSVACARPEWLVRGLLVWLGLIGVSAPPAFAQTTPPSSREELMRKWDVDRDGKVDASEAEAARTRMRRARNDAVMKSGTDPVTGRPRVATDPATGRPIPPVADRGDRGGLAATADEGGLILVPGTGEPLGGTGSGDTSQEPSARPTRPERPALPGTRVPATSSTRPSVTPNQSTGPGSPGISSGPGPRPSIAPAEAARRDRRITTERPGIISGGVRAGGPAARPGYGAGGPPTDLNAGRLPGGMPQTRGTAAAAGGGARGVPGQPSAPGRPPVSGRLSPQPGQGITRGPALPPPPSTSVPRTSQPGVQQLDRGRRPIQPQPQSRAPSTVPRVPRMSTDDFYGR